MLVPSVEVNHNIQKTKKEGENRSRPLRSKLALGTRGSFKLVILNGIFDFWAHRHGGFPL